MKIQNLKIGDRLQFAENTFACVGRSEVDISLLKGTVENLSHSLDGNHVWVKLDIPHKEFEGDEWGNCVQFNSDIYSSGGTSFEYLQKARKIEMKHFKDRQFSLFNYMCDILYDFYERNGLEHMCALDSLAVGNYKDTKHYLFLQRFCDVWDRVEERETIRSINSTTDEE